VSGASTVFVTVATKAMLLAKYIVGENEEEMMYEEEEIIQFFSKSIDNFAREFCSVPE
jgi:hypothetical protein